MATNSTKPLTPRHELFIEEYLKDYNGAQAAIRAGYAAPSARITASKLLTNPNISERIKKSQAEKIQRVRVEQDDVLQELLIVLKSSVDDFALDENNRLISKDGNSQSLKAVSSVRHKRMKNKGFESEEVEYKLWDKTRAIEMGMKHLGLMFDRLKIEDADDVLAKVLGVEKEKLPD